SASLPSSSSSFSTSVTAFSSSLLVVLFSTFSPDPDGEQAEIHSIMNNIIHLFRIIIILSFYLNIIENYLWILRTILLFPVIISLFIKGLCERICFIIQASNIIEGAFHPFIYSHSYFTALKSIIKSCIIFQAYPV